MDWNQRLLSLRELNSAPGPKSTGGLPARLDRLSAHQESAWPELAAARDNWFACRYREVDLGPFSVLLQYNPVRELSVSAAVDEAAIRRRPCFLCAGNMPAPERGLALDRDFAFFLNPFPIFYPHPVAVHRDHRPQSLDGALPAMLATSRRLAGAYTVLYNGPRCGASAPDHLHFQAFPSGGTPLETDVRLVGRPGWDRHRSVLIDTDHGHVFTMADYGRTVLILQGTEGAWLRRAVDRLVAALPPGPEGGEPLLNLVGWYDRQWTLCIFPRRRHRPLDYSTRLGQGVLVSPGSIDLAGLVITPRREDFETLDTKRIRGIFDEVCLPAEELPGLADALVPRRKRPRPTPRPAPAVGGQAGAALPASGSPPGREPELRVGLIENQAAVEFRLDGPWRLAGRSVPAGWFHAESGGGHVRLATPDGRIVDLGALPPMEPGGREATFTVRGVIIGVDFHWQRRQDQSFRGALELQSSTEGGLTVVNRIPLEEYLACVIASEMRADAPLEFLRAHAVISRSWLLAQLEAAKLDPVAGPKAFPPLPRRLLAWTDRQRHREFDVCADDHCQRYQGLGRVERPEVRQAVEDTRGLVLADVLGVVDARFSKCCGGVSEVFRSAWGDENLPSLKPVRDLESAGEPLPDLTVETAARRWIESEPESFCSVSDPEILRRILPEFDLETTRFFRWETRADARDLAAVVHAKSGWDPGELVEMIPIQRGSSGRLVRLLLVGTRGRLLVGKELEIRRLLSPTHLYSSAFTVAPEPGRGGHPRAFHFRGAGWGHGVGLCQIGAAAMACQGFDHRRILGHYFPAARVERWYA